MIQPITMIRWIAFRDMDDRRRSRDAKPGSPASPLAVMVGKLFLSCIYTARLVPSAQAQRRFALADAAPIGVGATLDRQRVQAAKQP